MAYHKNRITSFLSRRQLLAGGSAVLACSEVQAQGMINRIIELAISDRKVAIPQNTAAGPGVVRIRQGEMVEILWTSDEAARVHLHGYNIETQVEPGASASMRFHARATGRFPIETHGIGADSKRHITLVYIEVHQD
jgi:hypothetical protein